MSKEPLTVRIGTVFRRRREALKLSREKFAEVIGMHRSYYSAIERGEHNLRVDTLSLVCGGFSCEPWEVLREASEVKP